MIVRLFDPTSLLTIPIFLLRGLEDHFLSSQLAEIHNCYQMRPFEVLELQDDNER